MFNKHKIQYLEQRIRDLDDQDTKRVHQLVELHEDLERMMKHFGVKFVNVKRRVIVKISETENL